MPRRHARDGVEHENRRHDHDRGLHRDQLQEARLLVHHHGRQHESSVPRDVEDDCERPSQDRHDHPGNPRP